MKSRLNCKYYQELGTLKEIKKTKKHLESQFNAVNEYFVAGGSGKILHEQMNIKSLIWYPFAFDEHGYYVFTLNQILEQRQWTCEEIGFLESAAKQITLALIKIKLLEETIHAAEALQNANDELEQRVDERTKELRENEKKYRRITDNMSDIVAELDAQGIIKYISPSHQRIFGGNHEAQIGKSAFDPIHPEDRDRVLAQYMEGVRTKTDREVECRYRHVNGQYIWIRSLSHSLFDTAGELTGMIVSSSDITDRKRAEAKLRLAQFAIDNTFDAVFWTTPDGRIVDVNEAACRLLGYTRDELFKCSVPDIIISELLISPACVEKRFILKKCNSN